MESDTILALRKKIGERMEYTYEIYRGLKNLQATKIVKRSNNQILNDDDVVKNMLSDGEEVFFDLDSNDIWI